MRNLTNRLLAAIVMMAISVSAVPALADVGTTGVEQWYLKTSCAHNGDGLARTCAASAGASGAFNAATAIIWTSTTGVDDGDTLWILGDLREGSINPGTAGAAIGNTIKIRMDDPTEPGKINSRHLMTEATTAGNWTDAGGDVWCLSMSGYSYPRPRRVWRNGGEILQSPDLVSVGTFYQGSATRSEWWYDSGTTRLCLYSVGNPASSITSLESLVAGSGICTPFGVCLINAANQYFEIINPNIEETNGAPVTCLGCSHVTIYGTTADRRSCNLGKGALQGVLIADSANNGTGTIASDITIYQCTIDGVIPTSVADSRFEWPQQGDMVLVNYGATNINIHDNDIMDGTHGQVVINATLGTTSVTNVTVEHNYMTCRNAVTYCRAVGADGNALGKATGIIFRRNSMENFSIQSQINGNGNSVIANVWAHQRQDITWKGGVLGGKGDMLNIQAYADVSQDNRYANNDFYDSPFEPCVSLANATPGVAGGHIFENNIFSGCPVGGAISRPSASNLGNQTFRNNVIYTTGQTQLIHYKGTDYTVAGWEAACSGDICAGNIAGNPLFIAPPGDLRPGIGSPALGAGISYSGCIDILGHACGSPPTVGAYQVTDQGVVTLRLH